MHDKENTGAAGQGKFALVSIRLPVVLTFAALVGGLAAGIVGAMAGAPQGVSDIAGLIGGLWLRALQMTIIPLVAALLVLGLVQMILAARVGTVARRMIALMVFSLLGIDPQVRALRPQPMWVEGVALLLAGFAFAVLFRARRRDVPVVMLAAMSGYLISRLAGDAWGSPVGVFLAALAMTAGGNAYARWWNRPGAIVRVPGIIMLVPGSASLRGVISLFQQQDLAAGQDALIGVLNILLALVAGLLFGNLLVSTRRNL